MTSPCLLDVREHALVLHERVADPDDQLDTNAAIHHLESRYGAGRLTAEAWSTATLAYDGGWRAPDSAPARQEHP